MDICRNEGNTLEVEGEEIRYRNGFQNLLTACRIARDADIADDGRYRGIATLITGREYDLRQSVAIVNAYFARYFGKTAEGGARVLDFEQDSEAIYATFWQAYHIDLHASGLTAEEFLVLLRFAPEGTAVSERVRIRLEPIPDKADAQTRSRISKAKRAVALKGGEPETRRAFAGFAESVQNMAKSQKKR